MNRTPCRIILFGTLAVPHGRGTKKIGCAWEDWNPDPKQEVAHARLRGAGSFYWPTPRQAFRRAVVSLLKTGADQAKVETISGRPVARLYNHDGRVSAYALEVGE